MRRSFAPRLTLLDLIILIFATGLGLGCYVLIDDSLLGGQRFVLGLFAIGQGGWTSAMLFDRLARLLALSVTIFGGWSFALPCSAFLKPRAEWRRMVRGPGLIACLAAITGLMGCITVGLLTFAFRWGFDGQAKIPTSFWYVGGLLDDTFVFSGVAVAGAWSAQAFAGRWRPTPDAFDRLGRFVGVLWIAGWLVFTVRQLLRQ